MRIVVYACGAALWVGCGAAAESAPADARAAAERAHAQEVATLEQRNTEQAARLRELEARLALAQAELEELRAARTAADEFDRDTVRIGSDTDPSNEDEGEPASEPQPERDAEASDEGDRPMLRLYGDRRRREAESAPRPEVPEGLPGRLPMAHLPDSRVPAAALLAQAEDWQPPKGPPEREGASEPDPAVQAYRKGLSLVRDRRFEAAERIFARFVERHASHPYVHHARYWRGEVLYAQRRYDKALEVFARVVEESGARTAEALLKMGLCHKHLGRPERARALFEQVRRKFPDSVAAKLATQEEAS